jgi:hypothetical protein
MRILEPRTWFKPSGRGLLIDYGRVGCPVRGDADVESCFSCGLMLSITGGANPRVVCGYHPENRLSAFARRSG